MYLQDQIEMLKNRVGELEKEMKKNERKITELEYMNFQMGDVKDELENCIEKFELLEEENQKHLKIHLDNYDAWFP